MAGRSEGDRLRKVFHRFQKPAVLEGRVAERLEVLRHDVAFSSLGSSAPAAKHARHPHEKGLARAESPQVEREAVGTGNENSGAHTCNQDYSYRSLMNAEPDE